MSCQIHRQHSVNTRVGDTFVLVTGVIVDAGSVCGEGHGDEIFLRGLYYQESTGKHKIGTMRGSVKDPETLGVNLAKKLIWEVGKNE